MTQIILTILTIVLIEGALSFDNAAVIALVANKLPTEKQRKNVTKYGILGAFLFRGISIFCIGWILANPVVGMWLKLIGGLYLLKLCYTGLTPKDDSPEEGNVDWLHKVLTGLGLSLFWVTVVEVEWLDIVFSLDNLVAVVGLVSNIKGDIHGISKAMIICCIGVFLGIIMMRFVIQLVQKLMIKYPAIENSAYYVIGVIGLRMIASVAFEFFKMEKALAIINDHVTDFAFSFATLVLFLFPIVFGKKSETEQ